MTAPKLTPLPEVHPTAHPWRQPAPHSACAGTGEGKEQPMNRIKWKGFTGGMPFQMGALNLPQETSSSSRR